MRRILFALALVSIAAWSTSTVLGFCGFYVAKADTKLFNKASQVVLVRDGDRTVMTMANDFEGEPKEFAVVIPVPTFLKREQIHVGEKALVDHLDAYSAPRLVEYFDQNPCDAVENRFAMPMSRRRSMTRRSRASSPRRLGVTIEAQYTVGEYDILILSAQQSSGPRNMAATERLPDSARRGGCDRELSEAEHAVLRGEGEPRRAEQARVLLSPAAAGGLRVAEVHASYPSRHGQREGIAGAVRLRPDAQRPRRNDELPHREAAGRYGSAGLPETAERVRQTSTRRCSRGRSRTKSGRAVFLEYAWDMKWCDPCAADPLSNDELRRLGVFWTDGERRSDAERVPHASARPLRQRAFPRRSRVPGNRRSHEFPGTLRVASCLPRRRHVHRRGRLSTGGRRSARPRGRAAGAAHRLEHRGHPAEDG